MKKTMLTLLILSFGFSISAQMPGKSGEVSYEETIKLNFNLDRIPAEMRDRMPKERKSKKILYFNESASSYQPSKEIAEDVIPGEGRGRGMRFMMSSPDDKVYFDFEENLQIEQKEFMTRIFLIEGEPEKDSWKLTGKQKMILNYPCMEALQLTEKDTISAWFAPSIPVPGGPANYVNLPGLVLEVNINNGSRTVIAKTVDLKPIDKELISKPKKGKNVSREEFRTIVEEKTKEMGGEMRGGRMMIMRGGH